MKFLNIILILLWFRTVQLFGWCKERTGKIINSNLIETNNNNGKLISSDDDDDDDDQKIENNKFIFPNKYTMNNDSVMVSSIPMRRNITINVINETKYDDNDKLIMDIITSKQSDNIIDEDDNFNYNSNSSQQVMYPTEENNDEIMLLDRNDLLVNRQFYYQTTAPPLTSLQSPLLLLPQGTRFNNNLLQYDNFYNNHMNDNRGAVTHLLDPLFLMATLAFVVFLINSILGLVGRITNLAPVVRARNYDQNQLILFSPGTGNQEPDVDNGKFINDDKNVMLFEFERIMKIAFNDFEKKFSYSNN